MKLAFRLNFGGLSCKSWVFDSRLRAFRVCGTSVYEICFLLPLNRRRRLAAHVVRHPVNPAHFVDDAA